MNKSSNRRNFIKKAGLASAGTVFTANLGFATGNNSMTYNSAIKRIEPLRLPWKTQDPFIFCSYHLDEFPGGNKDLGPNSSLAGRNIGQDFASKDGWNMYHGTKVPGFPAHPHSGFETVTVVTKGMVDHSDSLGAAGRFGFGDVQWLTSGKGVQHAEMFPLLDKEANPFEIFQIWLNLPQKSKKVDPHYKMLWNEDIPVITEKDSEGKETRINLIAGEYKGRSALSPTPNSWAADASNFVQIWTFKMEAGASFSIPAIDEDVTRTLYFYEGETFKIGETEIDVSKLIELNADVEIEIKNGTSKGAFLLLQGRPIKEEVVQYGPFVANSRADLQETMQTYQQTEFGGWPWPTSGPVHGKDKGRFSKLPDGSEVIK